MKLQITVFLILFLGCSDLKPLEIETLEYIIQRDFSNLLTSKDLLPIKYSKKIEFTDFPIKEINQFSEEPKVALTPSDPNLKFIECRIKYAPFHTLILNEMISRSDYESMVESILKVKNKTYNLTDDKFTEKSLREVISSQKENSYQTFGYPILTKDHLIIYRNTFGGLVNSKSSEPQGAGMFFIYKKINQDWKLIHKIGTWIT